MNNVPCLNCLIIPICRRRYFIDMKNECSLVERYLFRSEPFGYARVDFEVRINKVYDAISPVHWEKRKDLPSSPPTTTRQFPTKNNLLGHVKFWIWKGAP